MEEGEEFVKISKSEVLNQSDSGVLKEMKNLSQTKSPKVEDKLFKRSSPLRNHFV